MCRVVIINRINLKCKRILGGLRMGKVDIINRIDIKNKGSRYVESHDCLRSLAMHINDDDLISVMCSFPHALIHALYITGFPTQDCLTDREAHHKPSRTSLAVDLSLCFVAYVLCVL